MGGIINSDGVGRRLWYSLPGWNISFFSGYMATLYISIASARMLLECIGTELYLASSWKLWFYCCIWHVNSDCGI